MKYTSQHLRHQFIEFFKAKGHAVVPSSSLVPGNDPTLLFTNSGMVQFKETFLGTEKRGYTRATSVQRCVRAGGKHNDLDNVGYTARHHTFFEMLGNFSFGDYFKREAISYAWEFLTGVLKIPKEKLWVTVFEEDQEAADIWLKEMGVDPNRFSRIGAKDNFWSMGDTGPCGPCTEIFYDHGAGVAGGPPGSPDADGDRYIEIWNLVFMQFNRDAKGVLHPLPKPSVDTGMGLERLAAVMQGVHDNYDTDILQHLIHATAALANTRDLSSKSLRVIADHIRASAFLIVDGVLPSNEGRGYVLRRVVRRAIRHGHTLGMQDVFFYRLVQPLVEKMGEAYPELKAAQSKIEEALEREEQQFAKTLNQGLVILKEGLAGLKNNVIPGEMVFKLYDTYGFPVDLTADIAREKNLVLDVEGFENCMEQQRARARAAGKFGIDYNATPTLQGSTEFVGYTGLSSESPVQALIANGQMVPVLRAGETGTVVLLTSPFYAESGGQVGDRGILVAEGVRFAVEDTQKQGQSILHTGRVIEGEISMNQPLTAIVNRELREKTARNHSATHLLHAAMRQVLGEHVEQKGSSVGPDRLRFDFSHSNPLTPEELTAIETLVNQQVLANVPVQTTVTTPDEAKAMGAMALFGEKYGEQVRVLTMGEFSMELCGGTHVSRTGDIGVFKIISTGSVASGVRRVEAITGDTALRFLQDSERLCQQAMGLLKATREDFLETLQAALARERVLLKELEQAKLKAAQGAIAGLLTQAVTVRDFQVLTAVVPDVDAKVLKELAEQCRDRLGKAVVVLACVEQGKPSIIAAVAKELTPGVSAGKIVAQVAQAIGGKGGGRPDLAQAGGGDAAKLSEALAQVVTALV